MSEGVEFVAYATYVVQSQRDAEDDSGRVLWEDIATVKVPPRTHRKTVIEKALDQVDGGTAPGPMILRVLDAQAAHETRAEMEQPPPRLKIG